MPVGHDSEKAVTKRNSVLAKIDVYLKRTETLMEQYPSEYRETISEIGVARSNLLSDTKAAAKHMAKAYHSAVAESELILKYHRIVDRITPEDPIFHESGVSDQIADYRECLRRGELKKASKALDKLEKKINGRGEPVSLSVAPSSPAVGADSGEVVIILSNTGSKNIIINSVTLRSPMPTGAIEVTQNVIVSGSSISLPLKVDTSNKGALVLHLTVTYTKELVPVTQQCSLSVQVS